MTVSLVARPHGVAMRFFEDRVANFTEAEG